MEKKMKEKLMKWVNDNYIPSKCAFTAERSYGNYDDCFDDGTECQKSWDAYEIGCILGMKLDEPEEQEENY